MPFMAGRQIGFMHPPFASFPSGGNVYNEKLLEYAGRCGSPLVSLPWRVEAPCGKWDLLVWDSLFMDRLARIADERLALLLHYLPSLQPELDFGARQMVTAVEHRAIMQADFAIATAKACHERNGALAEQAGIYLRTGRKRDVLAEPATPHGANRQAPHRRPPVTGQRSYAVAGTIGKAPAYAMALAYSRRLRGVLRDDSTLVQPCCTGWLDRTHHLSRRDVPGGRCGADGG